MSSNGDTNVVLRGVTHGAVDFLIKPVRVEELRNVWQHVVRRRSLHVSRASDEHSGLDSDQVGSHQVVQEQGQRAARVVGELGRSLDACRGCSQEPLPHAAACPRTTALRLACLPAHAPAHLLPPPPLLQHTHGIKRKESDVIQVQHETQGANKKPRVVWSVEMHQQVGGAASRLPGSSRALGGCFQARRWVCRHCVPGCSVATRNALLWRYWLTLPSAPLCALPAVCGRGEPAGRGQGRAQAHPRPDERGGADPRERGLAPAGKQAGAAGSWQAGKGRISGACDRRTQRAATRTPACPCLPAEHAAPAPPGPHPLQKYRLYLKRAQGLQNSKSGKGHKAAQEAALLDPQAAAAAAAVAAGAGPSSVFAQVAAQQAMQQQTGMPTQMPGMPPQGMVMSMAMPGMPAAAAAMAWQQQTMAMQAAAAAAAATGALPGAMVPPPGLPFPMPPGSMMPPQVAAAMAAGMPMGMMPPGMDGSMLGGMVYGQPPPGAMAGMQQGGAAAAAARAQQPAQQQPAQQQQAAQEAASPQDVAQPAAAAAVNQEPASGFPAASAQHPSNVSALTADSRLGSNVQHGGSDTSNGNSGGLVSCSGVVHAYGRRQLCATPCQPCIPACLPARLPACLPACLPAHH